MKTVFHGSPSKFERFDYKKIGTNGTSEGFGFYFTDSRGIAENYASGGYLYTAILKGKELSGDKLTITEKEYREMALHLNDKGDYLSNFGEIELEGLENVLNYAVELEYNSSADDADLLGGIINAYGNKEDILNYVHDVLGYGYVKDTENGWGNGHTVYVALSNDAIEFKNIEKMEGVK